MIIIKKTKEFGRGCYSTQDIKKGKKILTDQLLVFNKEDSDKLQSTLLTHYVYEFENSSAIALGMGSLFNHSKNPNVEAQIDEANQTISFRTIKSIKKDEQLYLDYGYNPFKSE